MNFTCHNCHKKFFRWVRKNRPQLFCSRECLTESKHQSQVMKGKTLGEKNGMWKADKVGYFAIHSWIHYHFGAAKSYNCEICGEAPGGRKMHWANIDGKYTRNRKKWKVLCVKCHINHDRKKFPENFKWTEENRKKASERMKGNKYTLGRKANKETRKKMSIAHLGHKDRK